MLLVGGGEIVQSGEVLACAHIYIIVRAADEKRVERSLLADADRAGRKSRVAISIVRRLHLKVLQQDAAQREVADGKLHRRVRLKGHALLQTVPIEASHDTALTAVGGLLLGDGGQGGGLEGGET
jgi:hypothetical protein